MAKVIVTLELNFDPHEYTDHPKNWIWEGIIKESTVGIPIRPTVLNVSPVRFNLEEDEDDYPTIKAGNQ